MEVSVGNQRKIFFGNDVRSESKVVSKEWDRMGIPGNGSILGTRGIHPRNGYKAMGLQGRK